MASITRTYIYTDGSCKENPGPGGCACVVYDAEAKQYKGYTFREQSTTNNRMELSGMILALEYISKNPSHETYFIIFSDSQYVVKGINEWMHGWIKNNWKNAAKDDVKNPDLWQKIYNLYMTLKQQAYNLELKWIKAHTMTKLPEKTIITAYQHAGHTYGSIDSHHIIGNHLVDMLASCDNHDHRTCKCRDYLSF